MALYTPLTQPSSEDTAEQRSHLCIVSHNARVARAAADEGKRYHLPEQAFPRYTVEDSGKRKQRMLRNKTITDQSLALESAPTKPAPTSGKAPIMRSPASWLLPSMGSVVFSAMLLGVIFLGQSAIPGGDDSAALSIRLGNDMLARGGLVPTNTLTSVGYGQPLFAWEWLSNLIFAGTWRLAGLNGLLGLVGVIVALTSMLLLRAVRKRGTPLLLALPLTAAAIALTSVNWQAGPRLFSLFLTLWWSEQLWSYWQSKNNGRRLWPLPFALALWANLDSGYVAGLLLLATATLLVWLFPNAASARNIDARRWQLTRVLIACLLAALLTPWGFAGLAHAGSFFSSGAAPGQAADTGSPDIHRLSGQLFLALLLLLGACGILRGWLAGGRAAHPADLKADNHERLLAQLAIREPGALGWTFVAVFTALAFFSPHLLALWGLIVAPIMGRELTSWSAEWASADGNLRLARFCHALFRRSWRFEALETRLRFGLLGALALLFVLVLLFNGGAFLGTAAPLVSARFSAAALPVEAVDNIQRGAIPGGALPDGAGFTVMEWSHYVEWTLPQHPIMVDARADLFESSTLQDYQTLLNAEPDWNHVINSYGIRWLLIPTSAPLAQVLPLAQGWLCQEIDSQHLALFCAPAPSLPIT